MQSVEASAATRKEAIDKALQELGAEMHDVENIEVIDEGSKGLFGFGAREVKVRVSADVAPPKPQRREKREDRPQRESRGGRNRNNRNRGEGQEAKTDSQSGNRSEPKDGEEKQGRGDGRRRRGGRGGRNRNGGEKRENRNQDGARSEGRRDDNRAGGRDGNAERPARRERQTEQGGEQEKETFAPISDELGREAAALLQEIIVKMGMEATVEFVRREEDSACLNVSSEDGGILIGRKGRTLSDLQYLINRIISQGDTAENTERLVVDVEGYLDRRKEMLEETAREFAQKAKDTGRNMKLKPMSPQERRIVHVALADDEEIRTFSLGDSLYRCVVIGPKNGGSDEGGRSRRPRNRRGPRRDDDRPRGGNRGGDDDRDGGSRSGESEAQSPYEMDSHSGGDTTVAENDNGRESAEQPKRRRRGGRRRGGGLRSGGGSSSTKRKDADADAGTFGD